MTLNTLGPQNHLQVFPNSANKQNGPLIMINN